MESEFDGQTEEEAVQNAIDALHIEKRDFEYEVIQTTKRGLFKKPLVRIRVRVLDSESSTPSPKKISYDDENEVFTPSANSSPDTETEKNLIDFVTTLASKIGIKATATITGRSNLGKICINLTSDENEYLIGRHGRMLDSLQVLCNAYCPKLADGEQIKVVLDVEDYRSRHEDKIIKEAISIARNVRKTGVSALLEPLNPYDRRLVHKALTKFGGVETESQGSGVEKRIRIVKI